MNLLKGIAILELGEAKRFINWCRWIVRLLLLKKQFLGSQQLCAWTGACLHEIIGEVCKGFQKEGQRNGGLSENKFDCPYQSKEFFVKAEYPFARVDDSRIGRDFH
jgi:hypothetical protein